MLNNSSIYQNTIMGLGTVGGFFGFPDSQTIYGLSNNHVIANLNNCSIDDPIFDIQNTQIGKLKYWITLNQDSTNFIDAALFEYDLNASVGWRILDNATAKPFDFIEPRLNGRVYMMLPDNQPRWGKISNPRSNNVMNFQLSNQHFSFSHLMEITPVDGRPFSNAGNSGSIILSSTHCIVGMLLGIETGGIKSYAIPFVNGILDYLPLVI